MLNSVESFFVAGCTSMSMKLPSLPALYRVDLTITQLTPMKYQIKKKNFLKEPHYCQAVPDKWALQQLSTCGRVSDLTPFNDTDLMVVLTKRAQGM